MENSNSAPEGQKKIKVSEILQMLEDYKTRDEIGTHYGLTKAEVTLLFKHDALKGKRTKVKPNFMVIDDVTAPVVTPADNGDATITTAPVVESEVDNDGDAPTITANAPVESEPTVTIPAPPSPVKRTWG